MMKTLIAILVLFVVFSSAEVLERSFQRIVGGNATTIEEYPFGVAVKRGVVAFFQWCGASILTSNAVLGAAHCFMSNASPMPPSQFRLRVGSTTASTGGNLHEVHTIFIHPQYNFRNLDYDIAVLRTSTNIQYISGTVAPVSIAGPNYYPPDNAHLIAIGWGETQNSADNQDILRHVQVYAVNHAECVRRYNTRGYFVSEGMICSGVIDVGGRDQCQGDSGGPLLHNKVQVGVCSWGIGCADAFFPGVNARVSTYSDWIVRTAQS